MSKRNNLNWDLMDKIVIIQEFAHIHARILREETINAS